MSQETLDAVVAIAGAVNAGVCQAVAGRGYKQPDYPKEIESGAQHAGG